MRNTRKPIAPAMLWLMSIASGATVANNYYSQPILKAIADDLHITVTSAGNIPLLSQLGYGLGLFLIVPLGDKINRKKLVPVLMFLLSAILLSMTCFSNIFLLDLFAFLIGCLSISAQVIVPLVSQMDPDNRDRNLSAIFLGMLIGILLSRILSGFMAQWFGWRSIYLFSAVFIVILGLFFLFTLPRLPQQFSGTYGALLRSTLQQFVRFPMLRRTALLGGLAFGVFCSFWTTLTFQLSGPPFGFKSGQIGLFGLVAVFGGLLSERYSRLLARYGSRLIILIGSCLSLLLSVLIVKLFSTSVFAFIFAAIILSLSIQSLHVTNIARIYSLDTASVSRINTVYLVCYFIGGALGTFVGVQCWRLGGWQLVTDQMGLFVILSLVLLFGSSYRRKKIKVCFRRKSRIAQKTA